MAAHLITTTKEDQGPIVCRKDYDDSVFGKFKKDLGRREFRNDYVMKETVSG